MAKHPTTDHLRVIAGSLLAGAVLASASPAAAAYNVQLSTQASAGGVHNIGASCRYNFSSVGGTCSVSGATSSATVTPNGGGNGATSTSAQETTSGEGTTVTTKASADLATASLHFASNTGTPVPNASGSGYLALNDVLHFAVDGASASTVTPFMLVLTLDGLMQQLGTSADFRSDSEVFGMMNFGTSDARFDLKNGTATGGATVVNYLDTYPSGATGLWTTNADHSVNTYTETFNVLGAAQDFAVALAANFTCGSGMSCDYGNSVRIGLTLPTGTSFTSDSGTFLSAATPPPPPPVTGAVPEPSTWAMMLAGFGMIGFNMRRRGTRIARPAIA